MVIVRQRESNLLKYNVVGDCLAIKLEGDLKSWTKYFEQIQFWSEIEFLPPSFPLPLYNVEEKSLASKQHCTMHCTMQERAGRYIFMVKKQKSAFLGLVQIYFVQVGQNISNKFSFGVKLFRTHFSKFFPL